MPASTTPLAPMPLPPPARRRLCENEVEVALPSKFFRYIYSILFRFLGTDPEPRPGLSSGHIPNSFSLPFNVFLTQSTNIVSNEPYTTFKTRDQIPGELKKAVLSQIKTLRTFKTMAESITYAGRSSPGLLKTLLSTVAFPGMLDVIIIYRDNNFGNWEFCPVCGTRCLRKSADFLDYSFPWQLKAFREMHSARKFWLVFCMDVYSRTEDFSVRLLESVVKKEEANGGFGYLVRRPVITVEGWTIRTRIRDPYAGSTGDMLLASAL
ncbi:hypothetical protein BJ322DRAFT_1190837 [Thelephora terrestris]|uniref:Uncharacterized protein n=1 Tax=Thelephora terrestris TaxID=56493 RepID=A0A9P6HG04_9AGAM|nr:hypothetical protein BJ322DRAFT_1190837 [Thelephora terrestris]